MCRADTAHRVGRDRGWGAEWATGPGGQGIRVLLPGELGAWQRVRQPPAQQSTRQGEAGSRVVMINLFLDQLNLRHLRSPGGK